MYFYNLPNFDVFVILHQFHGEMGFFFILHSFKQLFDGFSVGSRLNWFSVFVVV